MKISMKSVVLGAVLGTFLAAGVAANAQTSTNKTDKPKRDWYPFGATVAAVDTKAKTISLKKKEGERVLLTDDKTTLEENGKPATLADVKPGNYLHGKLHKNSANAEVLMDAKIELAPPAKEKGTNQVAPVSLMPVDSASTNTPAKKKKKTPTP